MTGTYNKELSPWEKKPSIFKNVKFGYLENIHKNIEAIKEGIAIQNEAWLKSAKPSFVAKDQLQEAISYFEIDDSDISMGISGINASFEWGISDVLWLVEQQRSEFIQMMQKSNANGNPTAAKLKSNAQNAYSKGWFEESLKDYLKVEKRENAEFSVYASIAMIYLFHQVNKERALDYFTKAYNFVKSTSSFYASFALTFQALIKRDLGKLEEAEQVSKTAVGLSPDFSVAIYQNAQLNALLGKHDAAMKMLNKAATIDLRYLLKAMKDDAFKGHQDKIGSIIENMKNAKKSNSEKAYRQITEVINEIHHLTQQYNDRYRNKQITMDTETISTIERGLEDVANYLKADSLVAYAFIEGILFRSDFSRMVHQAHKKVYHNVMAQRKAFIKPFEQKIQQVRSRCNMLSSEHGNGIGQIILALFYLVFGAVGAIVASVVYPSIPASIIGAVVGFGIALIIQFCIKRYGETYEIDYSAYDTYNEIEFFLGNLRKIEKKLPALSV